MMDWAGVGSSTLRVTGLWTPPRGDCGLGWVKELAVRDGTGWRDRWRQGSDSICALSLEWRDLRPGVN